MTMKDKPLLKTC